MVICPICYSVEFQEITILNIDKAKITDDKATLKDNGNYKIKLKCIGCNNTFTADDAKKFKEK